MPRLAIARFAHEGNSFSPVLTGLGEFRREWYLGQEAVAVYRGTGTEGGGAVAFLETHPEWQGHFLRMAGATPAGPVTREAYEAILDEILGGLRDTEFDAVYLSLHGAMVVEGMDLADYEIVRRVREAIGPEMPFGVSFDLHANLDPRTADLVTFSAGYKEHPHIDQKETALRVLDVLDRVVRGEVKPVGYIAKLTRSCPALTCAPPRGRWPSWRPSPARWNSIPASSTPRPMAGFPTAIRSSRALAPWSSPMAMRRWRRRQQNAS
jgi:microcystin degradation protein MlrC